MFGVKDQVHKTAGAAVALVALTVWAAVAPGETPLGHRDFLPTPDRPLGYRGDGSGIYPAATPPLTFDEQTKKNLLWVTKIPRAWSHSPPLVVGKRVFVEAEPDTTLCLDADTGKVLWQDGLDLLVAPMGGWGMHSGNGYSTAGSDGAAIYRMFSGKRKDGGRNGSLLVSYDLDGRRRWLVVTKGLGKLQTPLLVGDRYIVGNTAYDTGTGKVAWGPMKYDLDPNEPKPWGNGHNDDGSLVRVRLRERDVAVYPGGWCIDPRTGQLLAKALPMRRANGRDLHPMGCAVGTFSTPLARSNGDGSATVLFSCDDKKGLVHPAAKGSFEAVPPDADFTQPPWAGRRPRWAVRVLACRLSLDPSGVIRSEPLWKQPATLFMETSGGMWPHLSLCGDRIAVLNVKGQIGVLDLKTGRLLGKDFQPIYKCEYKTAHLKYKWDTPELIAAREEYGLSEEVAFGKGGGRNLETSLARMARTAYARSAVDSRNYLWVAHRWGEIYVLELTDEGFRQVARNRVDQPICWCSHAAPVFHGNRLYYRTWGHLYCFEETATGGGEADRAKPTLPQLLQALCDNDASVRDEAAEAIGRVGPAAVPGLVKLLGRREVDVFVLRSVAEALARIGPEACAQAVPGLMRTLRAEVAQARERYDKLPEAIRDSRLRRAVRQSESVRALGLAGAATAGPVGACLDGADDVMQRYVRALLERLGPDAKTAAPVVLEVFRATEDAGREVRAACVLAAPVAVCEHVHTEAATRNAARRPSPP